MSKVVVTEKALREMLREALFNTAFSGWSANEVGHAEVNPVTDPSAPVTDPINPSFTPQTKTEFGIAVNQLVKNLPDTEIPKLYDVVKTALDQKEEQEDEDDMAKKAAAGGTGIVEEMIRKAIRKIISEMHMTEAPEFVDPADVEADAEEHEIETQKKKRAYKSTALGGMADVGGASFEEIAKELGFSVAGAKQVADKALEKLRFMQVDMDESDREILIMMALNDYTKKLSKTLDPVVLKQICTALYIEHLTGSDELSPADVQLMQDHPQIVADLDGFKEFEIEFMTNPIPMIKQNPEVVAETDDFREFLHNHIKRARKASQKLINPLEDEEPASPELDDDEEEDPAAGTAPAPEFGETQQDQMESIFRPTLRLHPKRK